MTITDADIDADILAAVTRLSGPHHRPVRWTAVRSRVPGTYWAQTAALCRLVADHRLHHVKGGGTPYVWPADELGARIAARARRAA